MVAHPERKAQRALQRLAAATLCPVTAVHDADALAAAVDADTIAIVDVGLARSAPGLHARPARAWIAVPGEGLAPADPPAIDALLAAGWSHVIAHPMPVLVEELLATIQKLLRGQVFGLEKYMAWSAEMRSHALADTRDREAAVAALARDVAAAGLPDRTGSMASVIADELLANALYLAPIDEAGRRHRAAEPRDGARALTGADAVTLRWATDGRYLGIEVRDRWGSLDVAAVPARLVSGAKRAPPTGDGGMGMPLVYACASQLVISILPGQLTEVIALLDVRFRPTELGRSGSLHIFRGSELP